MKVQLVSWAVALGVLSAFGAITIAPENYTAADDITITVTGSESLASSTLDGHAGKVTKDGTGVLTFTGDGGTFAGQFVVTKGTVKARANAFATGSSVEVQSGATWDMAGGGSSWTAAAPKTFTIAGTGDAANGYSAALVRSSGTAIRNGGGSITLSADATITFAVNHNPGSITLNGHRLTKRGGGTFDTYGGTAITPGETGGIVFAEGSALMMQDGNPYANATSNNVLRFESAHTFNIYRTALIPWTIDAMANVTLCARAGFTPSWTGTVNLLGGNLQLANVDANTCMKVAGNVASTGPYGISSTVTTAAKVTGDVRLGGNITASGSGTTEFDGPVVAANVVNTKRGTLIFTNDVTLVCFTNAVGKSDADACGTIVFKGNVTQTNESVISKNDRGTVRFEGSERVEIQGPLGASNDKGDTYGTQPTGAYEVVSVKYFRHPNTTRLSGTFEGPQILLVSNSVWDCGNGTVVVGNNYSHGRAEFLDSAVTNKLTIGGNQGDPWGSRGSVRISGSKACWGALTLGTGNGSYGFLQADDSSVSVVDTSDSMLAHKGSGFLFARGSTISFQSSLKFAQGTSTGYGVVHLTGGTKISSYQFVIGNGILALEDADTSLTTQEGAYPLFIDGSLTTALNGGASIKGTFYRYGQQDYPWHLAVNGGVLRPTWTPTGDFFNTADKAPTTFVVGPEGVVVSTDSTTGYRSTFCVPMTAPTGKIVASVALPEEVSEATYFGPAKIVISGVGSGAAAIALYDFTAHRITGVKVVAGGTGYDGTTTATIDSPDGKTTYACTVTVADASTTGKGLVKRGPAILKLTQANTYKGPTTVEEGTLEIAAALPTGSALVITNGATATCVGARTFNAITAANGTLSGDAATTGNLRLIAGETLTVASGTTLHLADGAVVSLDIDVSKLDVSRAYTLVAGSVACDGAVTLPALPDPWVVRVRENGILLKCPRGLSVIIR